jgi:arginyl-tRNA synthetase
MKYEFLTDTFLKALNDAFGINEIDLEFEKPGNPDHGDLSINVAMKLAKQLHKPPRAIAEGIVASITSTNEMIESISIAGAGFINIKFSNKYFISKLKELFNAGENIGKSNIGAGKKANVEYVSVNPTGLLHLGHGRNAAIGDTIANLFEWNGWNVTREYYFNNAGNQMNNLAKSIYARYMQELDNKDFPFPEDGYHGEYIIDIAKEVIEQHGNSLVNGTEQDITTIRKFGENWCFEKIKATLSRMHIKQDMFYNEDSLYHTGKIEKLINDFKQLDLAYEKDNALWLSFTKLGLQDDRVIVKTTGEPTYRLPDIAYHREKYERGFDFLVDVFGADHIATVPDVIAGLKALGYDTENLKVIVHQFVTLTENGQQVKMSKRSGKSYTLDDLLDEVGADVVRFFLIMRGVGTHLEFDLGLAREQSDKNPVFYLQYAHARISSVFENAKERGILPDPNPDFTLLVHPTEIDLIKRISEFPEAVENAARRYEPQLMAEFLRQLAAAFHVFYHECRILGVEEKLMYARLGLANTVLHAMKNGLTILGISAPEKM